MSCIQNIDIKDFCSINAAQLQNVDFFSNPVLELVDAINKANLDSSTTIFFTIFEQGQIAGQAIVTLPHRPIVISDLSYESIEILCNKLKEQAICISGVKGPKDACLYFAKLWWGSYSIELHQGIYEVTNVKMPPLNGGRLITATRQHQDIVNSFLARFLKCHARAIDLSSRMIEQQQIFLWVNASGEIVSMGAKMAATISYIYTPKQHRRAGYASRLVACLASKLLNDGKTRCRLYSDFSNPTTNSIYKKIGNKLKGEALYVVFKQNLT
ncbi:MAG: GNAT family N-acetyltransferase [Bacteriovoracaceae bacterium]|nr:GNAT family N-acetyltransferase [Bacteriovoracaceae bacterium]